MEITKLLVVHVRVTAMRRTRCFRPSIATSRRSRRRTCAGGMSRAARLGSRALPAADDATLEARDRKHFFAIAALAMRQILVDRARKRNGAEARRRARRARDAVRTAPTKPRASICVAVDRALEKLEKLSERQARIVELRCLLGLTVEETAEALGVSERTVAGEWRLARAWLSRELDGEGLRHDRSRAPDALFMEAIDLTADDQKKMVASWPRRRCPTTASSRKSCTRC